MGFVFFWGSIENKPIRPYKLMQWELRMNTPLVDLGCSFVLGVHHFFHGAPLSIGLV